MLSDLESTRPSHEIPNARELLHQIEAWIELGRPAGEATRLLAILEGPGIGQDLARLQERHRTLMIIGEDDPHHPDQTQATLHADPHLLSIQIVLARLVQALALLSTIPDILLEKVHNMPIMLQMITKTVTRFSLRQVQLPLETAHTIVLHQVAHPVATAGLLLPVLQAPCQHTIEVDLASQLLEDHVPPLLVLASMVLLVTSPRLPCAVEAV